MPLSTDILVIGSGAGGAVTAATLAEAGRSVLLLEEGPAVDTTAVPTNSPEALRTLYRNAGLRPILGRNPIAFAEGCCVGGSTEINSAFWHRTPAAALERWTARYGVRDLAEREMGGIFGELEATLRVVTSGTATAPPSSRLFRAGLERVGAPVVEAPRAQNGDPTLSQFAPGAKRSMSRTFLPRATAAGARVMSGCRATRIRHAGGRATHVEAVEMSPHGCRPVSITAGTVFLCAGAIQTPALLRASGIRRRIGDSLCVQPMVKAAAEFGERLDSHLSVMPVYQMFDPASGVFLGGSVFTPGFLGMTLCERWPENQAALRAWRSMALYYTACRGMGRGSVRAFPFTGEAVIRYQLATEDERNLRAGLLRLCEVLLAGGARRIYPGVRGAGPVESLAQARSLCERLDTSRMSLTTVHVSSTCPMGEREALCPVDSFGRLRGFQNVRVSDASVIPDAPGVNPQGTVMALALRNAREFLGGTH